MRAYSTLSPLFWIGETGKLLRKHPDAQRVALYLITCPHSHQTGVYHLPLMYLCNEVGISQEGASEALKRLLSFDFCIYDETTEWIWVKEMAAWQIGTDLSAADKRCKGVQQYLKSLPDLPFMDEFNSRYQESFHLPSAVVAASETLTADSKTGKKKRGLKGASSDQNRSEQDQNRTEQTQSTRLPEDFSLTPDRESIARREGCDPARTLEKFCNYWKSVPGAKGRKLDWEATWRNWCMTEKDNRKPLPTTQPDATPVRMFPRST